MRDSYKDAETLIALERACDWRASIVLLEIASDETCLEDLRSLEWARATLDDSVKPLAGTSRPEVDRGTAWAARILAGGTCAVGLFLLPGGTGDVSALVGALGIGALAGALYPRVKQVAAIPA